MGNEDCLWVVSKWGFYGFCVVGALGKGGREKGREG